MGRARNDDGRGGQRRQQGFPDLVRLGGKGLAGSQGPQQPEGEAVDMLVGHGGHDRSGRPQGVVGRHLAVQHAEAPGDPLRRTGGT